MDKKKVDCPDCTSPDASLGRRDFLRTVGVTAAALALPGGAARLLAAPTPKSPAETAVKALYDSLTPEQKKAVCFEWDYVEKTDKKRGLLRAHVSNNWQITDHHIKAAKGKQDFYTKEQQGITYDIFKGIINPEWEKKFLKQLKDDSGAEWGVDQSLAIFGKPGDGNFEFVMTGRHMTIRADGHSDTRVAFGGPIFYGHAASGFDEKVHHPGNVFWHQAEAANKVYGMLDGKQQKLALVTDKKLPRESDVGFRKGGYPGIPCSELSKDQQAEVQKVLALLLEPYRKDDQDEALACLKTQGGLEKCSLAFYEAGDIGNDKEWDNWRLEGPSFVWYFRGSPHVHVWVNVANTDKVEINARG